MQLKCNKCGNEFPASYTWQTCPECNSSARSIDSINKEITLKNEAETKEIIELAEKLIIAYTSNPETVTRASPQNICETSYQLAEQFIDYKKQWLSERETK